MKKILIILIACAFASTTVWGEEKGKATKSPKRAVVVGTTKAATKAKQLKKKKKQVAKPVIEAAKPAEAALPAVVQAEKPAEPAKPVEVNPELVKPAEVNPGPAKPVEVAATPVKQVTVVEPIKPVEKLEKSSIELGFFSGDAATSSAPIPFKIETKDSKGLRFVRNLAGDGWQQDVEYTLGVNQGSYSLSDESDLAAPVSFGDITRTTFSSTVRFKFARGRIRPYAGWGLHYTELAKSLLADGSLKTEFASGVGPVAEWGIKVLLGKDFYIDVNTSQYFWSAEGIRFQTNVGNALISNINISNLHLVGLSIGKTF